jgi:hypothetical protein
MAISKFTRFAVFFLLAASSCFAQNQPQYFSASAAVSNPPYGIAAQLNIRPTAGKNAFIYKITVSASLPTNVPANTIYPVGVGLGVAVAEQEGCVAVPILNSDLSDPGQQIVNSTGSSAASAVVTSQPCRPDGIPYNSTNYTGTNAGRFDNCNLSPQAPNYKFDIVPAEKIIPGKGFAVYTNQNGANGFTGQLIVTYYWYEI